MNEIGKLPGSIKRFMKKNEREFSRIEGNLLSCSGKKQIQTIYITSSSPSEGKTITALSMAWSLSTETNLKILLIEGNLYSPKIHQLFNVDSMCGTAGLFSGEMLCKRPFRKTEYDNLTIVPHGSRYAMSVDIFRSKGFGENLNQLKQEFDYIILDGRAVFSSSDAIAAAKCVDGVIFVLEAEKTKLEVFQAAREKIDLAGGDIIGAVLNKRKYYIPKIFYKWI